MRSLYLILTKGKCLFIFSILLPWSLKATFSFCGWFPTNFTTICIYFMFNPRHRLRTIVVSLELKQMFLSLMLLGCVLLALHATADGAVATLPD